MSSGSKIVIELDEYEAVLLFGLVSAQTRGLPTRLAVRSKWMGIVQRLADGLLCLHCV